MSDFKPTLCIDYDGVVNPYSRGWQGGELYETTVTEGFFEWALEAQKQFKLVIYSARSKDETLLRAMQEWMHQRYAEWVKANELDLAIPVIEIEYAHEKPAAWLTIDDRAIRFDGDWGAPEFSPEAMLAYRPWNAPAPLTEASGAVRKRLVTDNNVMGQLARWVCSISFKKSGRRHSRGTSDRCPARCASSPAGGSSSSGLLRRWPMIRS